MVSNPTLKTPSALPPKPNPKSINLTIPIPTKLPIIAYPSITVKPLSINLQPNQFFLSYQGTTLEKTNMNTTVFAPGLHSPAIH